MRLISSLLWRSDEDGGVKRNLVNTLRGSRLADEPSES